MDKKIQQIRLINLFWAIITEVACVFLLSLFIKSLSNPSMGLANIGLIFPFIIGFLLIQLFVIFIFSITTYNMLKKAGFTENIWRYIIFSPINILMASLSIILIIKIALASSWDLSPTPQVLWEASIIRSLMAFFLE